MDRAIKPMLLDFSQNSDTATGPQPKPRRAPVFIHDAVTPLGRETLLLALWREQQIDQDE